MNEDKIWALNEAIAIVKEYSKGGGEHPASMLEMVYQKLLELSSHAAKK